MANNGKDFQEELNEKYSSEMVTKINSWVDYVLSNNDYYHSYNYPESEGYNIYLDIEKHDALNFTYYINIISEDESEEINCTFYTGVNVGCELVEYSVNDDNFCSSKYSDTEFEDLIDLELDIERTRAYIKNKPNAIKKVPNEFFEEMLLKKAQALLDNNKEDIMKIYSNQNYDNYVTGGGTTKTDTHYEALKKKLNEKGCFWKCLYRTVICERTLR